MEATTESPQSIDSKIRHDHIEIFATYDQYKAADDKENKTKWINQLIWELARHSVAEELVLYPEFEKSIPGNGHEMANDNRREHDQVKQDLYLADVGKAKTMMDYDAIITKVIDELRPHVRKEEDYELPLLAKHVGEERMCQLGKEFDAAKRAAPTHPHTVPPSTGSLSEKLMGMVVKPMDKLRDALRTFPSDAEVNKAVENYVRVH